jgi:UDPglucose 6-dehydrogenase
MKVPPESPHHIMEFKTQVLCIGAGYVGGPTMAVIADRCPNVRVTVTDTNSERIAAWNSDELPIFEPGLDAVVRRTRGRNLFFSTDVASEIQSADIIFVSVNTPTKAFGEGAGRAADLQYWEKTARDILAHADGAKIVVEKSTLPVRTAAAMARILNSTGRGIPGSLESRVPLGGHRHQGSRVPGPGAHRVRGNA